MVELGCGNKIPNDTLDYTAGINFVKKTGEEVKINEPVMRVFNSDQNRLNNTLELLLKTFIIEKSPNKTQLFL